MAGATTDFFSAKHKKLLWISALASILAWIALIVYTLLTLSTILNIRYTLLSLPQLQSDPNQFILGIDTGYLEVGINLFARVVEVGYPGLVYWLVLQGIAVGLKMIVETDINYREMRSMEVVSSYTPEQASDTPIDELAAGENDPVFYEPQEVLKIEGRLSGLAIAAIFAIIITNIPQFATMEAIIRTYSFNDSTLGSLSWVIAILIMGLFTAVECVIAYLAIQALASLLNILMEMEYNSRGGVPE